MAELLQFVFSGLTVGAIYALVALGFTLVYNASDIINFAQGEFVMLGGMTTVFMALAGVPLPLAALIAIIVTTGVGLALHRFAIEPAVPVVGMVGDAMGLQPALLMLAFLPAVAALLTTRLPERASHAA